MNAAQRRLEQSLLTTHDTNACAAFLSQLPQLISDELAGKNIDALYPDIVQHINICSVVSAEYDALYKMLAAAFYDEDDF